MNPEEIYKKTFLLPKVIKALAEEDFDQLGNRTKALGFVSILERELHLDLSDLREKIEQHFAKDGGKYDRVLEPGKTVSKDKTKLLLLLLLLSLLGAILYYLFYGDENLVKKMEGYFESSSSSSIQALLSSSSSESSQVTQPPQEEPKEVEKEETLELTEKTTTAAIQTAFQQQDRFQEQEKPKEEEVSSIQESSSSSAVSIVAEVSSSSIEVIEEETSSSSEKAIPTSLEIVPKAKLWIGVIYLDNHSKKTYLTSSPVQLDTTRDQLIYTGHGRFKIVADGEVIEDLNSRGKQRFIYKDGQLEKIDRQTFRSYNRGRDW